MAILYHHASIRFRVGSSSSYYSIDLDDDISSVKVEPSVMSPSFSYIRRFPMGPWNSTVVGRVHFKFTLPRYKPYVHVDVRIEPESGFILNDVTLCLRLWNISHQRSVHSKKNESLPWDWSEFLIQRKSLHPSFQNEGSIRISVIDTLQSMESIIFDQKEDLYSTKGSLLKWLMLNKVSKEKYWIPTPSLCTIFEEGFDALDKISFFRQEESLVLQHCYRFEQVSEHLNPSIVEKRMLTLFFPEFDPSFLVSTIEDTHQIDVGASFLHVGFVLNGAASFYLASSKSIIDSSSSSSSSRSLVSQLQDWFDTYSTTFIDLVNKGKFVHATSLAFSSMGFIKMFKATNDELYLKQAKSLIDILFQRLIVSDRHRICCNPSCEAVTSPLMEEECHFSSMLALIQYTMVAPMKNGIEDVIQAIEEGIFVESLFPLPSCSSIIARWKETCKQKPGIDCNPSPLALVALRVRVYQHYIQMGSTMQLSTAFTRFDLAHRNQALLMELLFKNSTTPTWNGSKELNHCGVGYGDSTTQTWAALAISKL
jgi:hypothetical protein